MYLKYFIVSTIGLFIGISIAFSIKFSTELFIVSSILCVINFLIYKFSKRSFGVYKNETSILLSFLFLFVSIGILIAQFVISKDISQKENFQKFLSQNDSFSGIVEEIKNKESSQQIIFNIKDKNENYKLKIITTKFVEYKVGDTINVKGKVVTENILLLNTENNINKSFDTFTQNNLKNIDGEISFPEITFLENLNIEKNNKENNEEKVKEKDKEEFFKKSIFSFLNFKYKLINIFEKLPNREVGALSSGVILGDSSLFSKQEIENFRVAGLSHVIVLSGFNISIIISFISFIFLNLNFSLRKRVFITIFTIFVFIIFVGAGPSIVRAGIMGVSLLIAYIYGRQYVAKQFLFLSAFIMILINPKIAVYDISFHLSFLATLGILYIMPIFDRYKFFQKDIFNNKELQIKRDQEIEKEIDRKIDKKEKVINLKDKIKNNILEIFKTTLAVQIFVVPYIIFVFNNISIFSIISNILVIPFIPIIMLLAFFIILFYFIFSPIAIFFSYISFIFSKYVFYIAEFISSISFSKIEINISIQTLIIIYLFLIFIIYFEDKRAKIKRYFDL